MEDKYVSKKKSTYIYLLSNHKWLLLHEIKDSTHSKIYHYFITHIKNVDYIVIGLHYLYRSMIYSLYPYAKVIINKQEIIYFYENILGIQRKAYEEAAITSLPTIKEDQLDKNSNIEFFIYCFYEQENKIQANKLYEEWQLNIPLNDKKIYKILRTIEGFYKEIFNYFEYKNIIK